jgi:cytochrome c-type biogenesis protein CcmH/NrfF
MLPYDEIGTISNIVVQSDPVSAVEHYEYDIAFTPASGAIPTLTEWGMIIMFVVLAGGIIWFVIRQRRRVATA